MSQLSEIIRKVEPALHLDFCPCCGSLYSGMHGHCASCGPVEHTESKYRQTFAATMTAAFMAEKHGVKGIATDETVISLQEGLSTNLFYPIFQSLPGPMPITGKQPAPLGNLRYEVAQDELNPIGFRPASAATQTEAQYLLSLSFTMKAIDMELSRLEKIDRIHDKVIHISDVHEHLCHVLFKQQDSDSTRKHKQGPSQ